MNKIPLADRARFPLDSTALNNLQNISTGELQDAIIALLGETGNHILSGVTIDGTAYSSGIVVFNGEILKFERSEGDYLTINQETETVETDEGTFDVLFVRTARATTTAQATRMDSLKRMNLSKKQDVVAGVTSYKFLQINNAFMESNNGLMYENTPAGVSTVRGKLTLKANSLGGGAWVTLYDFSTGDERYRTLTPKYPLTNPAEIHFPGTYLAGQYEEPKNDVHFRITRQGKWDVWVPNMTGDIVVFINAIYYNPQ